MKKMGFGGLVFCAVAAISGCRTHSPSWNGDWKLNATTSNVQAAVITISSSADDEYQYNDGVVNTSFRCDGEFRPIEDNRTQNCVKSSPTKLDRTRMEHGVKTNTYHWEISPDERMFTSTAFAIRANGPVLIGRLVASRISGSKGFAGRWQDVGFLQRHAGFSLKLDDKYLHMSSQSGEASFDAPLSGVEVAMHGANALTGMMYAVREVGPRELLVIGKLNGKEIDRESMKLSDDGRIISDSWWNPSRPTDKATLVYEKH